MAYWPERLLSGNQKRCHFLVAVWSAKAAESHAMNQDQFAERWRELATHMEGHVRYGAEVAATLDKVIVTLSGGALVFSMTFADRLAPARLWLPILFASWVAFAVSVISVAFSWRALQKEMRKRAHQLNRVAQEFEERSGEGKVGTIIIDIAEHGKVIFWNYIAMWSFVSAIILLGIFAGRNLLPP